MANRNKNRNRYDSDDNWQNQDRDYHQNDPNRGLVNYGRENELNRDRGWSNSDYRSSESGYGNTGYGSQGGMGYGSSSGNYSQGSNRQDYPMSGTSHGQDYGVGNYGRRDNDWTDQSRWNMGNQSGMYGNDRNYNSDYGSGYNTGSGSSGNWGNTGNQRYQDYNRRNAGNQQSNMYGGDTRNFGNANQGAYDRDWWDKTRDEVSSWFGDEDAERRRRMDASNTNAGPYKGRGPKGYKRSDERIKEDVCDRLCDNPMVDASDIDIKVEGSDVVLTGTVHSKEEKRRAEDIAESISGVTNVQNNLRVTTRGIGSDRSDYTVS